MERLLNRPCGACRALVPADTGCVHWKPGTKSGKRLGWVKGRARPVPSPTDLAYVQVLDRGVTQAVE